jgi:hypothetical protein
MTHRSSLRGQRETENPEGGDVIETERLLQGAIVWPFGSRGSSYKRFNIQPGDHFTKSDGRFESTWIVHQVVELPDVPPHARLVRHGDPARGYRTISVLALMDPTYYRRQGS